MMPTFLAEWGIFGVDMNVWLDAFVRLQIIVIVMTLVVLSLIYYHDLIGKVPQFGGHNLRVIIFI